MRRGVVLGMRVGQVCGVQGGRMHDKRLRAEGADGGPASTSEAFGCLSLANSNATDSGESQRHPHGEVTGRNARVMNG